MTKSRWKIGDFEFCEQQQILVNEQNQVRLEPMMCELLAYFCRHQNHIISKATLLDEVWHGRYVSDNTVSKLVTKLRKALQDDARNPQFIVTVPKRGYRLIATAQPVEENTTPCAQPTASPSRRAKTGPLLLFITLVIIFAITWFSQESPSKVFVSAKAVTSDQGSEYFPSFASDGVRFAYMNHDGHRYRLWVKNKDSGEKVEVRHGNDTSVGPGHWNDAGTQLAYLVATSQSCQYFIRDLDGLVMSEPELIHTCKPGSFGAIKFTHEDNQLVFAESPASGKPYSLYTLNLDSKEVQWLPQPDLHLGGNSQFDVHPTDNKLLISSPDEQQWEGFYQLDLDTRQLQLLFKLNAYICCGIWSHDGKHVVMMGEHPAREIVQYDLDGTNKTVLFTGAQQVHRPERLGNGVDYAFSAFNYDLNVVEYNIANHQHQALLNDTFDERLALLSPASNQIAYISLTSGNEELWLYQRDSGNRKKVTQFEDSRHYIDLAWSPDASNIAALTLNAIHIIDVNTGNTQVLDLPDKEFRGLSFKTNNKIAFSMKLGTQWQVVEYDLADRSMVRLQPKWKSVQYDKEPQNWLWVDQQGNWYQGENATPLVLPKQQVNAFYGRQFNVKKQGNRIAIYDRQKERLDIYEAGADRPAISLNTRVGHFSMQGDLVLLSQHAPQSNSSDIYQTYPVQVN